MACFRPVPAYRCADGSVVFGSKGASSVFRLACGQCVGCRLERSRQWAVRCCHEAAQYDVNSFVTLTYDGSDPSKLISLHYPDFQRFMKRVRRRFSSVRVRFYMCGEYGEEFGRPHFHACLFNLDFPDKVLFRTIGGNRLYTSKILEELWPFGFASVGAVTFESAAYVARYVMKKITGRAASAHYEAVDILSGEIVERVPEFNHMSLKPGIGASWISRFRSDVYPEGKVVVGGVKCEPPRYYDKLYAKWDPEGAEALAFRRMVEFSGGLDNLPRRLRVREVVAEARLSSLKRSL